MIGSWYRGGWDANGKEHGLGRWDFEGDRESYYIGAYDHGKQCGHWISYNKDGSIWYEKDYFTVDAAIIDHRNGTNGTEYLVSWECLDHERDSWVNEVDILDHDLIAIYISLPTKSKPTPPAAPSV